MTEHKENIFIYRLYEFCAQYEVQSECIHFLTVATSTTNDNASDVHQMLQINDEDKSRSNKCPNSQHNIFNPLNFFTLYCTICFNKTDIL